MTRPFLGTVGNPTVFQIMAYDQSDANLSVFNGIYGIKLYIDNNLVDKFDFGRWRNKLGTASPTAGEYYYCTTSACTPGAGTNNNPSVLQYKLSWNTTAGDHMWRIDVEDARGRIHHGNPRNGLPGGHSFARLSGTVQGGRLRLVWDLTEQPPVPIASFDVMYNDGTVLRKVTPDPVIADASQVQYVYEALIPDIYPTAVFKLFGRTATDSIMELATTEIDLPERRDAIFVYPNPSPGNVTIDLSLVRPSEFVEMGLFDVRGRRVRNVSSGALSSYNSTFIWDGRDAQGHSVPPGLYWLRVWSAIGAMPRLTRRVIVLP